MYFSLNNACEDVDFEYARHVSLLRQCYIMSELYLFNRYNMNVAWRRRHVDIKFIYNARLDSVIGLYTYIYMATMTGKAVCIKLHAVRCYEPRPSPTARMHDHSPPSRRGRVKGNHPWNNDCTPRPCTKTPISTVRRRSCVPTLIIRTGRETTWQHNILPTWAPSRQVPLPNVRNTWLTFIMHRKTRTSDMTETPKD